jgi:hypothetical protein
MCKLGQEVYVNEFWNFATTGKRQQRRTTTTPIVSLCQSLRSSKWFFSPRQEVNIHELVYVCSLLSLYGSEHRN